MKILKTKWYWGKRLIGNQVKVYSGPYDSQGEAYNIGGPGIIYSEPLKGRLILSYSAENILDERGNNHG